MSEEPGHITCPCCGGMNEASVQHQEEWLDPGRGQPFRVVVTVWTCHLCTKSWTNWLAEEIRDAALASALDWSNEPLYEGDTGLRPEARKAEAWKIRHTSILRISHPQSST